MPCRNHKSLGQVIGVKMEFLDLDRVWQWWKHEIVGLVPRDDVRRSASRAATVEIHIGSTEAEFHKKPRLGRTLPVATPATSLDEAIAKLRSGDRVVLTVDESHCLIRNRSVPKSALPELNSILALDLVHNTPFALASVFTGWFKNARPDSNGLQPISQVILKRDLVDPVFEAIAMRKAQPVGVAVRRGSEPAHAFVCSPDGQPFGAMKQLQWLRRCALSFVAATLLVLVASFAGFAKQQAALRQFDVEIEALQEPTRQARAALEAKTQAAGQRNVLQRLRQKQLPALVIWEELSRLLPDSAWVQTLASEADTIRIEGSAQSAEPLIPLLEASPLFRDVKFTSPVFKSSGADSYVRFTMSLGVEGLEP